MSRSRHANSLRERQPCARWRAVAWLAIGVIVSSAPAASARTLLDDRRAITLDDIHRLRDVTQPALSPDGRWIAYVVTRDDTTKDERVSDLWMVRRDGSERTRLTHGNDASESTPRWSPDGRWLAYLSARGDPHEVDQVWLLPRGGGEAERVTAMPGGVSDFVWSPDSKHLALVAADPADDLDVPEAERKPKPIVIGRYQFKEDGTGLLTNKRSHLYAFDLDERAATLLTPGNHDELLPAWSPDGRLIAYVTKRGADPDRHLNYDVYVVDPGKPGAERQLTTFTGADLDPYWETRPAWSPDAKRIAYLRSGEDKWIYYAPWELAIVDVASGRESQPVRIDRNVTKPKWSRDGRSIYALIEESRVTTLARFDLARGKVTPLTRGARFDIDFDLDDRGFVLLSSDDYTPARLSTLARDGRQERPLSNHNAWLSREVKLRPANDITFASADGTSIDGFLVTPVGHRPDRRVPTIVRVHGGPVYQFSHEFMVDWQLFAAHGYAVVGVNPRGSSGRGFDFARAIYAAWGGVDKDDVLAAVDHVVAQGVADPQRLGIGGWSYGGILTDFVIAQDTRFKAAISGAGAGSAMGTWAADQYVREYSLELGTPWDNTDTYLRASLPLLRADRIVTPTLFLSGQLDFNVPLIGSEQMYQALRVLGVPTELVIYPDTWHSVDRPSFARDRLQRYLAWYDRYLKRP